MTDMLTREITGYSAIELIGMPRQHPVPPELYGLFNTLLNRSSESGDDILDVLSGMEIDLPERPFYVLLFSLDRSELAAFSGRRRVNCAINLFTRLREKLKLALEDKCCGCLFHYLGYFMGVLYPLKEEVDLGRSCRELLGDMDLEYGFHLRVTISGPWDSIDRLETGYHLAMDLETSRDFYTGAIPRIELVSPSEISRILDSDQRTAFEQTFFQTAERICGTVQAGDRAAAIMEFRDQLRRIAENCIGLPYPDALNTTVNRFISVVQYRLAEQDLADWRYLADLDFSRSLANCRTLDAFLDTAVDIVDALMDHAKARSKQQFDSLMRGIRSYVEANATDVNMGLTAVAREFKLKPREAAESFRKYYGMSINDVIHQARVRKAKELLLTTEASVQDIAEAVGYFSLATMYRAFANVEGVPPGKLRQKKMDAGESRKAPDSDKA